MLAVEMLVTEGGGEQKLAGRFVLRGDRIEVVAEGQNAQLLKALLLKPARSAGRQVLAADDPTAWLEGLPVTYRGSRLRARLVGANDTGFKFKPVPVTDEDLDAYEKGRLAGLEKLAKVAAPVGVKGPKWVPPRLNDDGSLADA